MNINNIQNPQWNLYNSEYLPNKEDEELEYEYRSRLRRGYAFSVIDNQSLTRIASFIQQNGNQVIDIGAGTGYHAALLTQLGIHVMAFDIMPYNNNYCQAELEFYPVHQFDGGTITAQYPNHIPWLSWIDNRNERYVYEALANTQSNVFIYVGGGYGGGDASPTLLNDIRKQWVMDTNEIILPSFYPVDSDEIESFIRVYHRKKSK